MATFDEEQTADDNREKFRSRLKSPAVNIKNQIDAWEIEFTALRAAVSVDKQTEMDALRVTFVDNVKTALGIP